MKKVFIKVIDLYESYFRAVFNTGIILVTILFFADMLLLAFNKTSLIHPFSLVRFLFLKSNRDANYAIIDLSKTVYLFLIAWFAISFFRYLDSELKEHWTASQLFKRINAEDTFFLFTALIVCCLFDAICFAFYQYNINHTINEDFNLWIFSVLYYIRIYVPMVLFSGVIARQLSGKRTNHFSAHWFLLIISIWIFDQLSFQTSYAIELLVIKPFAISSSRDDMQLIISSVAEIPLISCLTIGYAAAMTLPLMDDAKLKEEGPISPSH